MLVVRTLEKGFSNKVQLATSGICRTGQAGSAAKHQDLTSGSYWAVSSFLKKQREVCISIFERSSIIQ